MARWLWLTGKPRRKSHTSPPWRNLLARAGPTTHSQAVPWAAGWSQGFLLESLCNSLHVILGTDWGGGGLSEMIDDELWC